MNEFIELVIIIVIVFIIVFFRTTNKCPKCGGELKKSFYDAEIDKQVYKCDFCGEKYI